VQRLPIHYKELITVGQCRLFDKTSRFISEELGVCISCLREEPDIALQIAKKAHQKSRKAFDLPEMIPKDSSGIHCSLA